MNGLHRGARCPLDGTHLTIGADEDSDMVLHDPDIAGIQAELYLLGDTWSLRFNRDSVSGGQGAQNDRVEMVVGKAVSLNGVWLSVAEHTDVWRYSDASGTTADKPETSHKYRAPSRSAGRRFLFPVVAILITWTQDSMSSLEEWGRPLSSSPAMVQHYSERDRRGAALPEAVEDGRRAVELNTNEASDAKEDIGGETAAVFREKLRELELDGFVSLNRDPHSWSVSGELSDEEMTRFKSMLERFRRDYPLAGPIVDAVHRIPEALPFRIVEATLGRYPSITLSDGERLYVGDTYGSYRLESVTQNRIMLVGKHRLALAW